MSLKEYTLSDLESKLDEISNVSFFLATGHCPQQIAFELQEHLQTEIELMQHMVGFMRFKDGKHNKPKEPKADISK